MLSGMYRSEPVFRSLYVRAFALTISVYTSAAPCSRQSVRKAASDTPAIGASTARPASCTGPMEKPLT